MQKQLLIGIIGLFVGLAVGFVGANRLNEGKISPVPGRPMSTAGPVGKSEAPTESGAQPEVAAMIERAKNEPGNFAVQMEMGQMYAKIGKFDKAAEFYKKGVAIEPTDFQANVVLANALFDGRNFEEAEAAYAKALELNPNDLNARSDLAATLVERSTPDYDRAIKEFETVLKSDPKHEASLYYLGITYFRKGDNARAQKALQRLEAAYPSSALVARLKQNISPK